MTWKRSPSVFLAVGANTLYKPTTCSMKLLAIGNRYPTESMFATSQIVDLHVATIWKFCLLRIVEHEIMEVKLASEALF